jgi:Swi5-dependent recombination DNA repair protein 1
MGGVGAWRESEKKKYDRANGIGEFEPEAEESDDADCEYDSQGEELPEEEVEYRKSEKRRLRQEALDAADLPAVEERQDATDGSGGGRTRVWEEKGEDDDVRML